MSEHILPGRWAESRQPNEKEIKATLVMRLPITEFSAKVRQGPPIDDEEDYAFPTWAGVIPLEMVAGGPIDDARLLPDVKVPEYARKLHPQALKPAARLLTISRINSGPLCPLWFTHLNFINHKGHQGIRGVV